MGDGAADGGEVGAVVARYMRDWLLGIALLGWWRWLNLGDCFNFSVMCKLPRILGFLVQST